MPERSSAECNFHETHNIYPNLGVSLSDRQHFGLHKTNEIKDYFVAEITEREVMSKRLVNILLLLTILARHCFICNNQ